MRDVPCMSGMIGSDYIPSPVNILCLRYLRRGAKLYIDPKHKVFVSPKSSDFVKKITLFGHGWNFVPQIAALCG